MRLLLQRVRRARVLVNGDVAGSVGPGLLLFAGFGAEDAPDLPAQSVWAKTLAKIIQLRIFPDEAGKLNVGLDDFGGEILVVSQFTLHADCRRGRRPSFSRAAAPAVAQALYERLLGDLRQALPGRVHQGMFGADMDVELVNWGPVTIWLDSAELADAGEQGRA